MNVPPGKSVAFSGIKQHRPRCRSLKQRQGLTLIELLVVIAIIGVLMALLLPAVQAAREAARRTACKNHLKQIGTAFILHHDTYRQLPTNGWGWRWVGAADRGYTTNQPGGWTFNVLPFLEQNSAHDLATGGSSTAGLLQTPVKVFYCPSRRSARCYPVGPGLPRLVNSDPVEDAAKNDYAVCAGDSIIVTPPGPLSVDPIDFRTYQWPPYEKATGIAYVLSQFRLSDVIDGTTNTAMVGEKYIPRQHYRTGQAFGDDHPTFIGDDADNRRWADEPPRGDATEDDISHFGSAHAAACHFVSCDGSVRTISYAIDAGVFQCFGNRRDKKQINLSD